MAIGLHHLARRRTLVKMFYPAAHLHATLRWRTNWKRGFLDKQRAVMRGSPLPSHPASRSWPAARSCTTTIKKRSSLSPSFAVNLLTTMIPAAATTAFVTSQRVDAADGGCSPFSFSRSRTHLSLAVSGMKADRVSRRVQLCTFCPFEFLSEGILQLKRLSQQGGVIDRIIL